ncbi:MAG: phage terminase small subunit P27 family [bacterium]
MTKKELVKYLEEKGQLENIDLVMVDQYFQNLKIAKKAATKVNKEGILINVRKDDENPYYQQHPALAVYNAAVKNLMNLSRKMGLSAYDRMNLKINVTEIDKDGFDDF